MFGPASSTEAASRLAYNLRGRARGICSESSSRNDIPFARGITGEGEREAPSMSGSSHRARRHRRTQLQRSRPFLILNVPGKKRNNFFATTITRALSRVWTGWAVGAKLETPPPRGSFGPWITTSLYANRAGAGDFRGTLYYIASPCDIILCIDVHDRHATITGKNMNASVTSPEGMANRRCRRASDNFLMEPLLPIVSSLWLCARNLCLYSIPCYLEREFRKTILGIILSRNIAARDGYFPPNPAGIFHRPSTLVIFRTRHAILCLFSPAVPRGTRWRQSSRREVWVGEGGGVIVAARFTIASQAYATRPRSMVESVRIEWPTIICQARTSACWEPQTTTAIASKRGLSKKKKKGEEERERERMEEKKRKEKKKTKPRTYRISPGRVIFLSWMLEVGTC